MRHIFNLDSPLMRALSKMADFILLNLFMIVSSIPLITIGTAMTALYAITGKMTRQEEILLSDYWKAFKSNLKQGFLLQMLLLPPSLVLIYVWALVAETVSIDILLLIGLVIATILYLGISAWVFPLQARFINSVGQTVKNAIYCGVMYLPRTILLAVINVIPIWCCFFHVKLFIELTPVWLGLWFSLSAYLSMLILKKPFQTLENLALAREITPQ